MAVSRAKEHICADCGVKIIGLPVVPGAGAGAGAGEGLTQAQIEKLKPTVFLCAECARERGLSFNGVAIGRSERRAP
jgi:ribosomal protein L34E